MKENFLSVSQYYHIRVTFLGVVYLLLFRRKMTNLGIVYLSLFQKKMTNLVFSTAISLSIVFLESSEISSVMLVGQLTYPTDFSVPYPTVLNLNEVVFDQ